MAAKLTGWNIDVVSESEHQRRLEAVNRISIGLEELDISDKLKEKLAEGGLDTAEKIIEAGMEGLTALPGIGDKTAEKILSTAKQAKDSQLLNFEQLAKENPYLLGKEAAPDAVSAPAPVEEALPPESEKQETGTEE